MKFTPEPWKYSESIGPGYGHGRHLYRLIVADGEVIAELPALNPPHMDANARLMVQSPCMYAILERLKEAYHAPLTEFAETCWQIAVDAETILNEVEGVKP